MSEGNKKRKLSIEDDSYWSKKKAAAFVEEVDDLQKSLKKCHGFTFVQALVDSLDDCQPQTIRMLKTLVDPLLVANTEPRHCVRCHNTYEEVNNRNNPCIVLCGPGTTNTGWRDKDNVPMVRSNCCGRIRREKDKLESAVCYRTRHTVNVKDVKYIKVPGDANEAEEGVKYNGHNPGVVTCTANGCDNISSELSELSDVEGD